MAERAATLAAVDSTVYRRMGGTKLRFQSLLTIIIIIILNPHPDEMKEALLRLHGLHTDK